MRRFILFAIGVAMLFALLTSCFDNLLPHRSAQARQASQREAIQRFRDFLLGKGQVTINRATGLVDFVRLDPNAVGSLAELNRKATQQQKSLALFAAQEQAFGLTDPSSELRLAKTQADKQGSMHLTFQQTYRGVPVFAGVMKTHFNSAGDLRAVNGVMVPDITLDPLPSRSSEEASAVAIARVQSELHAPAGQLLAKSAQLYVYRTGLARGVAGENHLVWQVEVVGGSTIRQLVFIDAHSGKFVDAISGINEALNRRVFDGENIVAYPPPSYPANPFWVEGAAFPTGVSDADSIIAATQETHDLYQKAFGYDSFDGAGTKMESIFNSGVANAFWDPNFRLTNFGVGIATDDVVGHEWTHAYTQFITGLISEWQPGALNESYSDIFGETIDLLNGRGLDTPGEPRHDGICASGSPTPLLVVNSPGYLQGTYQAAPALFGPPLSLTGITGNVVLVDDGVGSGTPPDFSRTDGCQIPFSNAAQVNGNIALIDRTRFGTCTYAEKVKNAQLNGAIAVIIANDIIEGDFPRPMQGFDPSITIPAVLIGYSDGQALRAHRARTVNVTLKANGAPVDNSYRWLIGEETIVSAFRDMWCPTCFGHPGKTSDREYFCGEDYNGGVGLNSGVPNHGYALLVDGGTYNGQTIQPLGLTKAAHIYFRSMSIYLTPTSDFADHAEALEAAAADLLDVNLPDLVTGLPSGQMINAADLEQVHKATLAVELRNPPTQCGFQPILAKEPPADVCPDSMHRTTLFSDDFETNPLSQWSVSHDAGSAATFFPRDWTWTSHLPDGRPGSGFFALDLLNDCTSVPPGQVGVLHLDSPLISIPMSAGGCHLAFDHWVATDTGYDGGHVLISVNGGPFKLLDPRVFIYNPYNMTLYAAVPGYEIFSSPYAGKPAFSGIERGSDQDAWGTSIIDLTSYAHRGDRIRLRWDLSTDYCYGTNQGWYLDNVRVYTCQP